MVVVISHCRCCLPSHWFVWTSLCMAVAATTNSCRSGRCYSYTRPFMQSLAFESAPFFRFDNEMVTPVSADEAVTANFGGPHIHSLSSSSANTAAAAGACHSHSTASMLIYVCASHRFRLQHVHCRLAASVRWAAVSVGDERRHVEHERELEALVDWHHLITHRIILHSIPSHTQHAPDSVHAATTTPLPGDTATER